MIFTTQINQMLDDDEYQRKLKEAVKKGIQREHEMRILRSVTSQRMKIKFTI